MPKTPDELNREKALAASAAAELVERGMIVGIGSGSTVAMFIGALGARARRQGWALDCVAASAESEALARDAGLTVRDFPSGRRLDIAVDGADEIGPGLALTKGGGGALLRERLVASASATVVIIADSSKRVAELGRFPLPIEVYRFAAPLAHDFLARFGGRTSLRADPGDRRRNFLTAEGNWIIDCHFGRIDDPTLLASHLQSCPAIAAHGLFLGIATSAIVADGDAVSVLLP